MSRMTALMVMVLCSIGTALAQKPIVTDTFDNGGAATFGFASSDCDGLHRNGIAYMFTIDGLPSMDCRIGMTGPTLSNNISAPNIEGASQGVLHLTFDVPTTRFGFGMAQSSAIPRSGAVVVSLHRPGAGLLRQMVALDNQSDPTYVGGRYDYDGPAVKEVTIEFADPTLRFALDNVTYFRPFGRSRR